MSDYLQVPMQVQLQHMSITANTVKNSLLWLRLVNTTMFNVTLAANIGIGRRLAAGAAAAAADVEPPDVCDVEVLDRAFVQVHGPAAFDMLRSAT